MKTAEALRGRGPVTADPYGAGSLNDWAETPFTAEQVEALCQQETLAKALLVAFARFGSDRVYVGVSGRHTTVAYPLGGGEFASYDYEDITEYLWSAKESVPLERIPLLGRALTGRRVALASIETTLQHDLRPGHPGTQGARIKACLSMWWDRHLYQGGTPESARMLLGLTVPLSTWQRLRFFGDERPVLILP